MVKNRISGYYRYYFGPQSEISRGPQQNLGAWAPGKVEPWGGLIYLGAPKINPIVFLLDVLLDKCHLDAMNILTNDLVIKHEFTIF